jgi:periplasmic copper chaperone A
MRYVVWERPATAYFVLQNDTNKTIKLTGVSSTECGQITLRQTKRLNGVERLLPVKSVSVPAHDKLQFHKSGFYLMCMSPHRTIVVGHIVPVILKLADGKTVTAQFLVKGPRENQRMVRAAR